MIKHRFILFSKLCLLKNLKEHSVKNKIQLWVDDFHFCYKNIYSKIRQIIMSSVPRLSWGFLGNIQLFWVELPLKTIFIYKQLRDNFHKILVSTIYDPFAPSTLNKYYYVIIISYRNYGFKQIPNPFENNKYV